MKSSGRPRKVSDDELWLQLEKYQERHPNEKINFSKLERESGITMSIWRSNFKDIIDNINHNLMVKNIPATSGIELPSIDDMKKRIEEDSKMLDVYLKRLIKISLEHNQYTNQEQTIKDLKFNYENTIRELEMKINELKEIIDNQQEILNKYILMSMDKQKREEEGIQDNIIYLTPETYAKYDKMFDDLMK